MNLGTIRRIDDLGRIVLPKAIRKALRIKNGDNLEIYSDGISIIMKKHSEMDKLNDIIQKVAETIKDELNTKVYISDKDKIIVDTSNTNYENKEISEELINIINKRKIAIKENIKITNEYNENGIYMINPIIINGDIYGSIIVKEKEKTSQKEKNIIETLTKFLIKNIE